MPRLPAFTSQLDSVSFRMKMKVSISLPILIAGGALLSFLPLVGGFFRSGVFVLGWLSILMLSLAIYVVSRNKTPKHAFVTSSFMVLLGNLIGPLLLYWIGFHFTALLLGGLVVFQVAYVRIKAAA